jgi:hypothetical protein
MLNFSGNIIQLTFSEIKRLFNKLFKDVKFKKKLWLFFSYSIPALSECVGFALNWYNETSKRKKRQNVKKSTDFFLFEFHLVA